MSIDDQVLVVEGALEEPAYSEFLARAPGLSLVDGLDTRGLRDLTGEKIEGFRGKMGSVFIPFISGTTISAKDTSGRIAEVARLYNRLAVEAKKKKLAIGVELHAIPLYGESFQPNRTVDKERLKKVRESLVVAGVPAGVFRDPVLDEIPEEVPDAEHRGVYARVMLE